jgi:hypothetical protein
LQGLDCCVVFPYRADEFAAIRESPEERARRQSVPVGQPSEGQSPEYAPVGTEDPPVPVAERPCLSERVRPSWNRLGRSAVRA